MTPLPKGEAGLKCLLIVRYLNLAPPLGELSDINDSDYLTERVGQYGYFY